MELLVVTAILMVMISLLLPVLKESRVKAKRLACVSNMRQTLMCLTAYAGDQGEFPINVDQRTWDRDWVDQDHECWGAMSCFGNSSERYVEYWEPTRNCSQPQCYPVARQWYGSEGAVSHWRGYLVKYGYGAPSILGCAVPLRASATFHSGDEQNNFYENFNALKQSPPYIYLGPGTDIARVSTYHLGIAVNTRRWRSFRFRTASPLLGECCWRRTFDPWDDGSRTYWRYHHHSGKAYYPNNGEPWWYYREIDMNVGWTDGRVRTHVKSYPPGSATLFTYDWTNY